MNLNQINEIYSKALLEEKAKLIVWAEKVYQKKILPRIMKAVKKGESNIEISYFTTSKGDALRDILKKKELKYSDHCSDMPFTAGLLRIHGWKLIQIKSDPNNILKGVV